MRRRRDWKRGPESVGWNARGSFLQLGVLGPGFRWDFAGTAGLTRNDPNTGFVLGIARSFDLQTNPKPTH